MKAITGWSEEQIHEWDRPAYAVGNRASFWSSKANRHPEECDNVLALAILHDLSPDFLETPLEPAPESPDFQAVDFWW